MAARRRRRKRHRLTRCCCRLQQRAHLCRLFCVLRESTLLGWLASLSSCRGLCTRTPAMTTTGSSEKKPEHCRQGQHRLARQLPCPLPLQGKMILGLKTANLQMPQVAQNCQASDQVYSVCCADDGGGYAWTPSLIASGFLGNVLGNNANSMSFLRIS